MLKALENVLKARYMHNSYRVGKKPCPCIQQEPYMSTTGKLQ